MRVYEWVSVLSALVNNKSQCIFNLFNARSAFVVTISAPKTPQPQTECVRECVCVAQVCASSSVCVCVSQSISLWLIMRTSLNKSSTTFQCHCRKLKDHSLISLAGCWLCACPSTPLCACSSSPLSPITLWDCPSSLSVLVPVAPCQSVLPASLPVVGASIILCRHNLTTGNAAHSKGRNDTYTTTTLGGCEGWNWN